MYFISKWPVLFPMFGPICRCRVISVMTKTFFPTSLSTYFIGKLAVRFYFLMGSMIRYLYKFANLASFLCSMTCRELLLRRNYYAFPDLFLNIFSQQFQPNFELKPVVVRKNYGTKLYAETTKVTLFLVNNHNYLHLFPTKFDAVFLSASKIRT